MPKPPTSLRYYRIAMLLDKSLEKVLDQYPIKNPISQRSLRKYLIEGCGKMTLQNFIEHLWEEEDRDKKHKKPVYLHDFLSDQDNVVSVMYQLMSFFEPRPTCSD